MRGDLPFRPAERRSQMSWTYHIIGSTIILEQCNPDQRTTTSVGPPLHPWDGGRPSFLAADQWSVALFPL